MAKKQKKKFKKYPLVILFFVVAILVATFLSLKYVDFGKIFGEKREPGDSEEAPADAAPNNVPEHHNSPEPPEPTEPQPQEIPGLPENVQYDGTNPNLNDVITGAITYAGVSNDELVIRVNIDQYLNQGTCNLILSRDGVDVYGREAAIIDSASTSTCEGFNIPLSELTTGKYQVRIKLSSERKTGLIMGEASV